jgi:hemoglobin-like flavoprotein
MTEAQRRLIERSLLELLPMLDAVGTGFYTRLFALDSALRPLVPATVEDQLQTFQEALGVMIATLQDPTTTRRLLAELGAQWHTSGIPQHAYATAGQALLVILALALGPRWTPDMRDAWAAFYAEVVAVMAPLHEPAGPYPWGYSAPDYSGAFL